MNRKGFTTVELILTIVLVAIIMATITNVTFAYRDKSKYEETKTEIINYKNTLTKIIYDDILDKTDPIIKFEKVSDIEYNLISKNNNKKTIKIEKENDLIKEIIYDNIVYKIPDSEDELIEFREIIYKEDVENNLYSLEILFTHLSLDEVYKIKIIII